MDHVQNLKRRVRGLVSGRTWKSLNRLKQGVTRVRRRPSQAVPDAASAAALACVVSYNPHGAYCVPTSSVHRPVAQTIMRGLVWERRTVDYIAARADRGDIVHAGAYFGDFLPALSRRLARGAALWAFEPNPENFRCAQITVLLNALDNVQLMNAGLGETATTGALVTRFADGSSLGGLSGFADPAATLAEGTSEPVAIMTIDATVPADRTVGVVHLDIEGFEQKALTGAMRTLVRCRPIVIVETEPVAAWLEAELFPLGYAREGFVDDNTIFAVR